MNVKPINPKLHGILDYAISSVMIAAPTLLKLKGGAKTISRIASITDGIINVFSDHGTAVSHKINLKTNRNTDLLSFAGVGTMTLLTATLKNPKTRIYFLTVFATVISTVLLINWKSENK